MALERQERSKPAKPLIVGVVHGWRTPGEMERVANILEGLPRGTKVGVEIDPQTLGDVERAWNSQDSTRSSACAKGLDALCYAVVRAIELGHEVVPLDSRAAVSKHTGIAAEWKKVLSRRGVPSIFAGEYRKLTGRFHVVSRVRSVWMARKILEEKPAVSFMGDLHAEDLKPALGKTHDFSMSPARATRLGNAYQRLSVPFGLTRRLDAYTRKRLGRLAK